MKIIKTYAELMWITPESEKQIEKIARVCYKSEPNITDISYIKMIRNLIKNNHTAMLEHACASIKFVCDRGVSHELVRHRIPGFAMESSRYCNYSKDKFGNEITVIQPEEITEENYTFWYVSCKEAEDNYFRLINKVKPEIARAVLPTCLKTEIVVTTNMREWRHIIKLRTDKTAHPQIREIIDKALYILYKECPIIFEDLKKENSE